MIAELYPRLVSNAHYRGQFFSHVDRIVWAAKVRQLGYWAVRQAMLKRGASMGDVAWVLVTTLKLQGVN